MPIPVTSENWEIICRLYKKIAPQTYPPVKEAIQDIHLNISPSHTLGSKTFSLRKLVKQSLEAAFISWLSSIGREQKPFLLYLEKIPGLNADVNLYGDEDLTNLNREWRKAKYPDYPQLNFFDVSMTNARHSNFEDFVADIERQKKLMEDDVFTQSHTTETLRNFLNLCKFLSPIPIKVGEINRHHQDEAFPTNLENKTINKRRSRRIVKSGSNPNSLPYYLTAELYVGSEICLACDLRSEEVVAKNQLKNSEKLTANEKSQFNVADEITHKKGFSQHYCHHHSDVTNRAGNTKSLRDRPYFLALLSAMHRLEVGYQVDAELVCKENWRRFSALACESRSCRKLLHKISELTPLLYDDELSESSKTEIGKIVVRHITSIYKTLGLTSEQSAPFNPTHLDLFKLAQEIDSGPYGGTQEGEKMKWALTASKIQDCRMPNLVERKIKTPRKSRSK